ncbi:MAG: carboxypeptidase regulatory-like domain-containing protein [Acidobacteriia bacterium]|nr:carboxypeptidase regulatory-like domain-containing protein [Terriglobia bacterium]
MRLGRAYGLSIAVLALLLGSPAHIVAQNVSGTLKGRVTDPSSAVIPQATISVTGTQGQAKTAVTDNQGTYEIKGLAPGSYTVTTTAKGFATSTEQDVAIAAGQTQEFDIALEIEVKPEKVEVEDQSTTVNTTASDNASSIVIRGKDLEALPDDPDELQQDLEALAGPSAGPNGGQIYIDGFTGGQLPPKSSIREIRVNQNPFSAEYDKLGYGRIEILTKPGTDKYHGQFFIHGNDSAFNSLNPFVANVPPYHSELYNASVGGPLSKKASFFFTFEGRNINDSSVVNATILDPTFNPVPFTQAVPNPRTRFNLSPCIDYQLSKNNTLTARYQFLHNSESNEGVGRFSLASQAYDSTDEEHTLQISDTQVLSATVVNETRFEYAHDNSSQTVQSFQPTISVLGAFTGGGNQSGNPSDIENRYELQNYTSMVRGNHLVKFGGRLRASTDSSSSNANFNGVFTFPSILAYQITEQGLHDGLTPAEIRAAGGGASQFSITAGQPLTEVSQVDVGLYAQDDWRIRPSLTLSYGLRFETQNNIHDHGDWAPRLSVAWGLGRGKNPSPKTVLRAGFGMFHDRFAQNLVLQAERLNGTAQQLAIVTDPDFYPNIPALTVPGTQVSPTIYQISPNLRAPMTMQTAVSVEHQITPKATMAVTYLYARGEHQLFLRNINAPLPGTFDPADPTSGVRPLGGTNNIYQYDSEGIFRQNQLIVNMRVNAGSRLSLFGYYTLNYANSNLGTGGGGSASFLSNQYDPMADYGRSSFDVRHRVFLGGTLSFPYAFRLSPFMLVTSGQPFNVTTGQDLNGDSIFNDRPTLISTETCPTNVHQGSSFLCTPLGTFNPAATSGLIPVNFGTGPTLFTLNLRLSKTFGFGRETKNSGGAGGPGGPGGHGGRGGGPGGSLGGRGLAGGGGPGGGFFGMGGTTDRRYNLTLGVSVRNLLNRVNFAPPVGDLSSPLFGQSNALAGGPYSSAGASRRIDLQVLFSF